MIAVDRRAEKQIILVTGATGFIGRPVTERLANNHQIQVTAFDLASPEDRGFTFPENVQFIQGDLENPYDVRKAVEGAHSIVHLGAKLGALLYRKEHAQEILATNRRIDKNIFEESAKARVEIVVYASSAMVYQHAEHFPSHEEDLAQIAPPTEPYGLSKWEGEILARQYHQGRYGKTVVMRYSSVYGPGERRKALGYGGIHVVGATVLKVLDGQYPMEIYGDPQTTRSFLYITDVTEATVQLTEEAVVGNSKIQDEVFNIGPEKATSIEELGKMTWELLREKDDSRPFHHTVLETDANPTLRSEISPEKIEKALHWKPNVPLQQGILYVAESMRQR